MTGWIDIGPDIEAEADQWQDEQDARREIAEDAYAGVNSCDALRILDGVPVKRSEVEITSIRRHNRTVPTDRYFIVNIRVRGVQYSGTIQSYHGRPKRKDIVDSYLNHPDWWKGCL
jgi:hypothetical protein